MVTTSVLRAAFAIALLAAAGCGPRTASAPKSTPTPIPVATGDYPEYGYAPDLSWVAGRVGTAMRGGMCMYVSFAHGVGAPWGGKFALSAAPGVLDGVHSGDTVVVRGALSPSALDPCGAPEFAVSSVEMH